MDDQRVREIVRRYRDGLQGLLGARLKGVVLYGSHARGDASEGSDIDVLCILSGEFDYGEMMEKTSELTARMCLEHEVLISRVFVSELDYRTRQLPFFANVRREGVPV